MTYLTGIFKTELKNRFLCTVSVDGEDVTCYIPSSCKLSNFMDMSGRVVLLKKNTSSTCRTKYAVHAVKYKKKFVLLNMSYVNTVIENELKRRYFSFLGKRRNVSREYRIDSYKSDIYIHDSNTVIEIKSILSLNKTAIFPTIYSERAIKQLENLSNLLDQGYKVCYLFVSLNSGVKNLCINKDIDDYYKLFQLCMSKGMMVKGVSVHMNGSEVELYASLHLNL